MRKAIFLCLLLLSTGALAQVKVSESAITGLPADVVVEYAGKSGDSCFAITRSNAKDWDGRTYAKVYDGSCSGDLVDYGQPMTMSFRDGGTVSFSYRIHPTPKGPDFDVISIGPRGVFYKKNPATLFNLK